jgi:hypothetical protein
MQCWIRTLKKKRKQQHDFWDRDGSRLGVGGGRMTRHNHVSCVPFRYRNPCLVFFRLLCSQEYEAENEHPRLIRAVKIHSNDAVPRKAALLDHEFVPNVGALSRIYTDLSQDWAELIPLTLLMTEGGDKSELLERLYPVPLSTGVLRLPGPTAASAQALLNVLLHNREHHHLFVNDKRHHKYVGFRNVRVQVSISFSIKAMSRTMY